MSRQDWYELGQQVRRYRPRHDPSNPKDYRGDGMAAFVGFSRTFFWDRDSGQPRLGFTTQTLPLQLKNALAVAGTSSSSFGDQEADLYLALEGNNRSLVLEGARLLLTYAYDSGWLEVVTKREEIRREDQRNQLGFITAKGNTTLESNPSAYELSLCRESDESPLYVGGSYLSHCHFSLDYEAWQGLGLSQQQRLVGITRQEGNPLVPSSRHSLASALMGSDSPPIFRREADCVAIQSDGSVDRGITLQTFQRQPVRQFGVIFNRFLKSDATEGQLSILKTGILKARELECYFLPSGYFAEFPGQQFVQPQLFIKLQEGLNHFAAANYEEAIACYEEAERLEPTHMWPYALQAECYHDLQSLQEARATLERAAKVNPTHHLYLEQLGWQHYLESDYATSASISRQAIAAYYEDSYRSYPYHDLGAALLEMGNAEEAEIAFRRSVARVNLVAKNCFGLANALDAQGRYREARKIYDRTYEVAEYLLQRGAVTRRDVRTVLELVFIHYRSESSTGTLERIRQLLITA